jgi:thiamine biosynthesis lipoprotein
MMGTFVEVVSPDRRSAAVAFAEIRRIEKLLSKYDPASEISRLNQAGYLKASSDTYSVLKKSAEFWRVSNGAFDITVAPLLDAWGFTDRTYRRPEEAEISSALKKIGMNKIIFDDAQATVTFATSGMKVDLGGIAKGYALDCAAKKLRQAGVTDCLINAGGQVYALGKKFRQPWVIGIRDARQAGMVRDIALTNASASTSGDYEQFFMQGAKRYTHIFDPKTGYPVETDIMSVTVTAPDGATADALSTCVFALGRQRGLELIKKFPAAKAFVQE